MFYKFIKILIVIFINWFAYVSATADAFLGTDCDAKGNNSLLIMIMSSLRLPRKGNRSVKKDLTSFIVV